PVPAGVEAPEHDGVLDVPLQGGLGAGRVGHGGAPGSGVGVSYRVGGHILRGGSRVSAVTTALEDPSAPAARSPPVNITVACPLCARAFAFDLRQAPVQRGGREGTREWWKILAYYPDCPHCGEKEIG